MRGDADIYGLEASARYNAHSNLSHLWKYKYSYKEMAALLGRKNDGTLLNLTDYELRVLQALGGPNGEAIYYMLKARQQ